MAGRLSVGIVGGAGAHGWGIALRLRWAGYDVLLGSRDSERAAALVSELPDDPVGAG